MQITITKDREDLEKLEAVINKNVKSFYEVGKALTEIKERELYKIKNQGKYKTFEAYCKDTWDMGRRNAYYLIGAAAVIENVNNCSQTPATESQTRPLAKLDPEEQRNVWQEVIATAPNGKITAAHVDKVVKSITGKQPSKITKSKEKPEPETEIETASDDAVCLAMSAISTLSRIAADDPMRDDAFAKVETWIKMQKNNRKANVVQITGIPSVEPMNSFAV